MLENRSATKGIPDHCAKWPAIVSVATFDRAYVEVGIGKWSSSTGAYRGGTSNGSPSVVSLDAHTTRESPSVTAAWNTLKFIVMFALNVTAGVASPGAGMLARCTTADAPLSASVASP